MCLHDGTISIFMSSYYAWVYIPNASFFSGFAEILVGVPPAARPIFIHKLREGRVRLHHEFCWLIIFYKFPCKPIPIRISISCCLHIRTLSDPFHEQLGSLKLSTFFQQLSSIRRLLSKLIAILSNLDHSKLAIQISEFGN